MAATGAVERIVGAVVGGIVADAAAMPCHWVYDVEVLRKAVGGGAPEFLEPAANHFYTRPTGDNSCYGDQALVLLRSVKGGDFSAADYAKAAVDTFGAKEGPYSFFLENEVKREDLPIASAWLHASVKQFVTAVREGADPLAAAAKTDEQVDGCVKVAPLLAALRTQGSAPEASLSSVAEMVRVTQAADIPVAFAVGLARILGRVLDGAEITDAYKSVYDVLGDDGRPVPLPGDQQVREELQHVISNLARAHSEYVAENGRSCSLPVAWKNGLHAAASDLSPEQEQPSPFVARIRAAIMEGGCNCSRSSIAGMLLGARHGIAGVPEDWRARAQNAGEALALAQAIAAPAKQ